MRVIKKRRKEEGAASSWRSVSHDLWIVTCARASEDCPCTDVYIRLVTMPMHGCKLLVSCIHKARNLFDGKTCGILSNVVEGLFVRVVHSGLITREDSRCPLLDQFEERSRTHNPRALESPFTGEW